MDFKENFTLSHKTWIDITKRVTLAQELPLTFPLSINIEPTGLCNFSCNYCKHSDSEYKKANNSILSSELFFNFITVVQSSGFMLKNITFAGFGEPLLHPEISFMIKEAKKVARNVTLITNGSLLTQNLIDEIIDAGLSNIRISLQGVNKDDYYRVSAYKMDFDKFIANLEYLNTNKRTCKVCLKAPVYNNDKSSYHDYYCLYNELCDDLIFEGLLPIVDSDIIEQNSESNIFTNVKEVEARICPLPFYMLSIKSTGNVFPCCYSSETNDNARVQSLLLGDISSSTIVDIWGSVKLNNVRTAILKEEYSKYPSCLSCPMRTCYNSNHYDNIDCVASRLLEYYLDS